MKKRNMRNLRIISSQNKFKEKQYLSLKPVPIKVKSLNKTTSEYDSDDSITIDHLKMKHKLLLPFKPKQIKPTSALPSDPPITSNPYTSENPSIFPSVFTLRKHSSSLTRNSPSLLNPTPQPRPRPRLITSLLSEGKFQYPNTFSKEYSSNS